MFDILAFVCERIANATGLPVATEVPEHRPDRFVTVYRDGGGRREHVDNPTLTVQTWGTSDADAYDLALRVRAIMEDLTFTCEVSDVSCSSLRVNNDTTDGQHRYEAVYFLICRR